MEKVPQRVTHSILGQISCLVAQMKAIYVLYRAQTRLARKTRPGTQFM
jgi:hypothetical protein